MVKAVVFDLDDTLISERQYIESGYHHISRILSDQINKDADELYQLLLKLLDESPKYVFNRLYDSLKISYTTNDILQLVEQYRDHFPSINFFPDVLPCLDELRERRIKNGIITDGFKNTQIQKIEAVKAYDYFDEIIITDELGKEYWKPHPKAFEIIQERLHVKFDEMIYVGDNPEKDFNISKIYPVITVRILREGIYRAKCYLDNIKENHLIHSLIELSAVIDRYSS